MPRYEIHGRIEQRRRIIAPDATAAVRHWVRDHGQLPDVVIARGPDGETERIPAGFCNGCGAVVWDDEPHESIQVGATGPDRGSQFTILHERCA